MAGLRITVEQTSELSFMPTKSRIRDVAHHRYACGGRQGRNTREGERLNGELVGELANQAARRVTVLSYAGMDANELLMRGAQVQSALGDRSGDRYTSVCRHFGIETDNGKFYLPKDRPLRENLGDRADLVSIFHGTCGWWRCRSRKRRPASK